MCCLDKYTYIEKMEQNYYFYRLEIQDILALLKYV